MYGIVRAILMSMVAIVAALIATDNLRAQDTLPKLPVEPSTPQHSVAIGQREVASPPNDNATSSRERVLILQDGGVLIGDLRQEGDRYLLKRGTVELQIRRANVMLVANSLVDAYEQRRNQTGKGDAVAHLRLAEWCMRYDLLEAAAAELGSAQEIEPLSARLTLLNRRLAMAREQAARPKTANSAATTKTLGGLSEAGRHTQNETPASERPATAAHSDISDLPAGAVESFTRRVQPVLVNSCSMAGCHQLGGREKFQLDRAILHGMANRRSTMQNLSATLALVDRENPQLSRLLTVPRQRHGGVDKPIFGPRQEAALQHLVAWVALVSEKPPRRDKDVMPDNHEAVESKDNAVPLAPPIMRMPRDVDASSSPDSGNADVQDDDWQLRLDAAEFGSLQPPRVHYGAQLKRWEPRDPFDPEIFNRQIARPPAAVSSPNSFSASESSATPPIPSNDGN